MQRNGRTQDIRKCNGGRVNVTRPPYFSLLSEESNTTILLSVNLVLNVFDSIPDGGNLAILIRNLNAEHSFELHDKLYCIK